MKRNAQQETELYKLASEKKNQQVEQEHHELQQFVYTLREQGAATPKESPPKTADPPELQWVGGWSEAVSCSLEREFKSELDKTRIVDSRID